MLKDIDTSQNLSLDFSISKGKTIDSLYNFLDNSLPHFVKDLKAGLTHEDDISQECSIYLNREARNNLFMFHFQHKYPGKTRTSDFSVISAQKYSSKEPLFVIEAKRLPTPGSKRKREYVEGNLGAIERFKRGLHGTSLPQAVILGYVQKNTFDYWHREICNWISDLVKNNTDSSITWTNDDLLIIGTAINGMNKYTSNNSRMNEENIFITHYWIYTSK